MQTFTLKITGTNEVLKTIRALPEELMKKAERFVLREGAKPILEAAKANAGASKRTGTLLKSLGISVRKVKARGGTSQMTARVGARSGGKWKLKGMTTNKKGKTSTSVADPSKYAHLVELGTSHSAAKPFIRPAIESGKGQALNNMAASLDKFLTKTCAAIKAKG